MDIRPATPQDVPQILPLVRKLAAFLAERDPAKYALPEGADVGERYRNWLVKRATRADAGHTARVLKTWIDAPFYARSALATRLFGEDVQAVHESLSLGRFRSPIVQSMLPYRMRRAFW